MYSSVASLGSVLALLMPVLQGNLLAGSLRAGSAYTPRMFSRMLTLEQSVLKGELLTQSAGVNKHLVVLDKRCELSAIEFLAEI